MPEPRRSLISRLQPVSRLFMLCGFDEIAQHVAAYRRETWDPRHFALVAAFLVGYVALDEAVGLSSQIDALSVYFLRHWPRDLTAMCC